MPLYRASSGGGGVSAVPVDRTAFVDLVNGNDASGVAGRLDKPFLTVAAAYAAARLLPGDSAVKMGVGAFVLPGGAGGLSVVGNGNHIHFIGEGEFATILSGEITASNIVPLHLNSLTIDNKITLVDNTVLFLDRDVTLGAIAVNVAMPDTSQIVIGGNNIQFYGTTAVSLTGTTTEIQLRGKARCVGALGANVTLDVPLLMERNDNFQTGTTYTFKKEDSGITVHLNNAAAITATVPASLGADFVCNVMQDGAGQVTFVASGTTLNSYGSLLKIAGQHGTATLKATAANVLNLSGALTA